MPEQRAAVLSAIEAARRIYNTRSPTADQVGRTVEKIELGHLARSSKGGATTTVEAVADYLARRAAHKASSGRRWQADPDAQASLSALGSLGGFYRELLKDYFLAVVMRRRMTHRSQSFRHAVVATQAGLLVAAVGFAVWISALALRSRLVPIEHRVVQDWVTSQHADAHIDAIQQLPEPPSSFRVNFRYGSGGKQVFSSLILTLDGKKVVDVNSEL